MALNPLTGKEYTPLELATQQSQQAQSQAVTASGLGVMDPRVAPYAAANNLDINNMTAADFKVMEDNNYGVPSTDGGLTGMEMGQLGLGGAQLGLGIASFLDNKKTAKLQRENLQGQIASNKDILQTRQARQKDISKYFG